MPVGVKIIFTVVIGLFTLFFVLFVNRGDRGAADAHVWRGGERDGLRQSIMRPDGKFRRYTKALVVTYLMVFLGAIWLLL
jgi:hypothetical protein